MCQVRVLSYGTAEEGQSDCRDIARLDWRLEECLFLSSFGQDLFQFAVVDGIDTDATVPRECVSPVLAAYLKLLRLTRQ